MGRFQSIGMGEIVIYEGVLYMCFQWPDPISFVADVIAIVGIATLAVATAKLYKDAKKAREPQNVSHGCLEFYDVDEKVGINMVPLAEVTAIPRAGDNVLLPGEYHDQKFVGSGNYKVIDVEFTYLAAPDEVDQPCPALPSKIIVRVRNRLGE
jgi:hypothetical protein